MARKEISLPNQATAYPEVGCGPEEVGELSSNPGLRPQALTDFVGQGEVRRVLELAVTAARGRNEAVDHVLFYGPPGLGKTTLAMLVANEMGTDCVVTSGPVLERPADLVSTISTLKAGDVLFIDEIHRLKPAIEEFLYPAMEDQRIDIRVDEGPGGRSISLPVERFTLIGATTRSGLLTAPLRARFGLELRLEPYEVDDLTQIVLRAADIQGLTCAVAAARAIAKRCRGTPRLALRLLQRVRDYAQVHGEGHIDENAVAQCLALLGIDESGLNRMDRTILEAIIHKHRGGPVGLNTLAASISEDPVTLEESHEPFLLQQGLLERTPRGRIVTPKALTALGVTLDSPDQPSLL